MQKNLPFLPNFLKKKYKNLWSLFWINEFPKIVIFSYDFHPRQKWKWNKNEIEKFFWRRIQQNRVERWKFEFQPPFWNSKRAARFFQRQFSHFILFRAIFPALGQTSRRRIARHVYARLWGLYSPSSSADSSWHDFKAIFWINWKIFFLDCKIRFARFSGPKKAFCQNLREPEFVYFSPQKTDNFGSPTRRG